MHSGIINRQLINVNHEVMDPVKERPDNQPMVEKTGTFADRFERLRGGMAYQALSDAIYRKTGIRISPQGMHKWSKGGAITPENLRVLSEFFGVREGWLLFGEGPEQAESSLNELVGALPDDSAQQVLDFIRYKIERADSLVASERLSHYLAMIDDIKKDMAERKKVDNEKKE